MASFDPTIAGAVRRFKRVVLVALGVGLVGSVAYTVIAGASYTSTAGIIIAPLPANISPTTSGSASGVQNYTGVQVAMLRSLEVSNQAAAIVNREAPNAHLSGQHLHQNLVVAPPGTSSKGSTTNGSLTNVTVTLGSSKTAMDAANAVLQAYEGQLKVQIHRQAATSVAAYNAEIANASAQLSGVPPPTPKHVPTTHTPTTHLPHVHTTLPPHHHTTTTHTHHTTTTKPAKTTTTQSTSPTQALGTGGAAFLTDATSVPTVVRLVADINATETTHSAAAPASAASTASTASTGTTGTTGTTGSSASNAVADATRAALLTTISSLTKAKSQVAVNEAIDLAYHPTTQAATPKTTTGGRAWLLDILLGLVIGLVIGVVIAYILSISRRRFEGEDAPERLYETPLLARVPAFEAAYGTRPGLPMVTEPAGEAAEAYRSVATALRALRGDGDSLLVALSAAEVGAGTTTTVANTALALAEMGERVLVVDADPIGRGLTHLLSEPNRQQPGLAEVLGGRPLAETVVAASAGDGRLGLLPTSASTDMAVHRWRPGKMRAAFEEAAERFDMVLIDTPPVGTSSYGVDVASAAEHLVLVIPHHDAVAHHAEVPARLEVGGVKVLGYAYNGAPASPTFVPYFPVLYTNGQTPRAAVGTPGPPTVPVPATSPAPAAAVPPASATPSTAAAAPGDGQGAAGRTAAPPDSPSTTR